MQLLPTSEERAWLTNELALLLRLRGHHQYLSMPIVEPTSHFFPDPWSFSLHGLDRVVRRLMQYASLQELQVFVGTFSDPGFTLKKGRLDHAGVAGVFLGLERDCAHFAFNEVAPADCEYMAGVMGHEVAHAYRAHHGLPPGEDLDREEWLTDLTATFLGFGILVANNSYRYRTSGEVTGVHSRLTESMHRVGYLTTQAFGFLLAMQMEARVLEERDEKRLLRHLEANQAACVRAALDWIRRYPDDTVERLGLPDEIPPSPPLESILRPLPEVEEVRLAPEEPEPGFNSGRPVFRVGQTKILPYTAVGVLSGFLLGMLAAALFHAAWLLITLMAVGAGAGFLSGTRIRFDVCSDPGCNAVIPDAMTNCPGCDGSIAGRIRRASDRLAAEEALERSRKKRPRPAKRRRRGH